MLLADQDGQQMSQLRIDVLGPFDGFRDDLAQAFRCPVALLSDAYWRRRFRGSPQALG
jgi:hypothetical protein